MFSKAALALFLLLAAIAPDSVIAAKTENPGEVFLRLLDERVRLAEFNDCIEQLVIIAFEDASDDVVPINAYPGLFYQPLNVPPNEWNQAAW